MNYLSTNDWGLRSPLARNPLEELGRLFGTPDGLALSANFASPRFNIEEVGDNAYAIRIEVPGFERDDIEISHQDNTLRISGQIEARSDEEPSEDDEQRYLHRGFSRQAFSRQFSLPEHVKVDKAKLANGILDVRLTREVPESAKPKLVKIDKG